MNATTLPTADEQAWLDATPVGERRSVTKCGTEFCVDRRAQWPAPSIPSVTPRPYDGTAAPWTVPHVRIVPDWQPLGTIVCADTSPVFGGETVTKVTFKQ